MPITLRPSRSERGFTLIELLVVVGVAAILVGLSLAGLGQLKRKTAFSTAATTLAADLEAARTRALTEQRSVWAIVLRANPSGTTPDRVVVLLDGDGNFDPASYDPNAAVAAPDVLLADRTLELPARIGPPAGYGALPAGTPFSAVPTNLPITFASTLSSGPYVERGLLEFLPSGAIRLSNGAATGSISLTSENRKQVIAVVGPTASIRVY